jgi:hypothetical protein
MLGAMALIAPAGGTARSAEAQTTMWASSRSAKFQIFVGSAVPETWDRATAQARTTESNNITFSVAAISAGPPLYCSVF